MALALIPNTVECLMTPSLPICEQPQGSFISLDRTRFKFLPSVNDFMLPPKAAVLSPHTFVSGMISACPISLPEALQHGLLTVIDLSKC